MSGAIASFLHIASLAVGLACLFLRSWFVGGSLLERLHAAVNRVVDLAMMMPSPGPAPAPRQLDELQMRRVLTADSISLVAGSVWVGSGVWRLSGLDKGTDWYLGNDLFLLKMALVAVMFTLEMVPMLLFIQWRYALGLQADLRRRAAVGDTTPPTRGPGMRLFLRGGDAPSTGWVPALRRILTLEEAILLGVLLLAPFMTRGIGYDAVSGPAPVSADACAVKRLLQARCDRCHQGAAAQGGFDLAGGHAALVDAPSIAYAGQVRVRPGDPAGSLLMSKLTAPPPELGARMPLGGELPAAEINAVKAWIAAGAPACIAP